MAELAHHSHRDRPGHHQLLADKAPSSSQAIAVATLFPIGGILLTLSGLTLTATVVGLTAAFPLFLLFSPVLVPAAGLLGLTLAGFFASGAMGVTALTALSWVARLAGRVSSMENVEGVKRRMAEAARQVGQRTKDVGQGFRAGRMKLAGGRQQQRDHQHHEIVVY